MHAVASPRLAPFTWLSILLLTVVPVYSRASQGGGNTAEAKLTAPEIIALAKSHSPKLASAIASTLDQKPLAAGTAWLAHGPDFFFAVRAPSKPELWIDDARGPALEKLAGSNLWYAAARIEPVGKVHSFSYLVAGSRFWGEP